jgi:hypothetical protein
MHTSPLSCAEPIFGCCDSFIAIEDHIHGIGTASNFLLVPAGEGFGLQPGQQLLYLGIAEFGALDASGRSHALNSGYPPEAGQLFRREGFNDFPAPFELIDSSDEFEDFRGDRDASGVIHG